MSRQGIAVTRCHRLFQKRPDRDDMGMPARASQQAQRKETRARDRYKNLRAVLAERNHDHSLVRWCLDVHKLRTTADRRHSTADDRRSGTVAFLPAVCRLACPCTIHVRQNTPRHGESAFAGRQAQYDKRAFHRACQQCRPAQSTRAASFGHQSSSPAFPGVNEPKERRYDGPDAPQRRAQGRAKVRSGAVEEGEMDGSLPDIKEVTMGIAIAKNCSKRDDCAKAS